LNSIVGLSVPDHLEWEVIVVDNNSCDHTEELVRGFEKRGNTRLVYVKERRQGLSHARNRGVRQSRGRLVAFIDDDVIVEKSFVENIVKAFAQYDVQCIGGRILPVWETCKPKWLSDNLYYCLALLDYGELPLAISEPKLWGANLAFKVEAFEKYGLFDTKRGRLPGKLYAGEETHFLLKLLKNNQKVMYVPNVVVHHYVSKERMRKMYFRRWKFDQGELRGLIGDYSYSKLLRNSYQNAKEFTGNVTSYWSSPAAAREKAFEYQLSVVGFLGFLMGRFRRRYDTASDEQECA
jgi:glycosyltransferase involved in cell wall biosynthesis